MDYKEYKPTYRWVLISPVIEEKTESGIYKALPKKNEEIELFLVEDMGPDATDVKIGDKVLIEATNRMVQLPFKKEGKHLFQVLEQQIIGIFRSVHSFKLP
jgi:hypothetical protein